MRRLLAVLLSSTLALSAPAQTISAPAPRVTAPVIFSPVLTAPSAVSLTAPALVPSLSVAPLVVPAALAPLPLPAAAIPAAAAPVAALAAPAPVAAIAQLGLAERLPAPSAFDGSTERKDAVEPARTPSERPEKPKTAYGALKKGLALGVVAAAAVPVAWGAEPFHALAFSVGAPAVALLSAWTGRLLWRLARRIAGRPAAKPAPATKARRLRALAAGILIGAALAVGTVAERPRIVETAASAAVPGLEIRRIDGREMPDAVKAVLMQNPVGREVLRGLEDRGGRVRMPDLYVFKRDDAAIGTYVSVLDGLFIDESVITSRGWTVEEFLADKEKQTALAADAQSLMLHELRHADQYRRRVAPWQFHPVIQVEHEAYMTEHFYAHERLRADPENGLADGYYTYRRVLEDVDAYVDGIQDRDLYKNNVVSGAAVWTKWRESLRASWPAHQAEAYELLARRNAKSDPKQARADLKQAREIAAAHGLPAPKFVLP
ncbi:MAG: hypothetical protein M0D55_03645 [Elusimicrobiota bacterium]|nr:MAG: hypothetical protein M0D55_03645 [Elusimicrobiota bacterium]